MHIFEGLDALPLAPHAEEDPALEIVGRQEVGGSSIEASKIAGHSTIRMTEEYTKIRLTRQEERVTTAKVRSTPRA